MRDLRYLHSFPTRRSSDLLAGGLRCPHRTSDARSLAARERRAPHLELRLDRGEDRKSTRLNSSHPSISYAVFCLKKKIYDKTGPRVTYEYIIFKEFNDELE